MQIPFFLFAALAQSHDLSDSSIFILKGFVFVIIVLGFLSIVTAVIGSVFAKQERQKARAEVTTESQPMAGPEINEAHVPVIMAAVYHVMKDEPHRVVAIRLIDSKK